MMPERPGSERRVPLAGLAILNVQYWAMQGCQDASCLKARRDDRTQERTRRGSPVLREPEEIVGKVGEGPAPAKGVAKPVARGRAQRPRHPSPLSAGDGEREVAPGRGRVLPDPVPSPVRRVPRPRPRGDGRARVPRGRGPRGEPRWCDQGASTPGRRASGCGSPSAARSS